MEGGLSVFEINILKTFYIYIFFLPTAEITTRELLPSSQVKSTNLPASAGLSTAIQSKQ